MEARAKELLDRLVEDGLSPAEREELNAIADGDAEVRKALDEHLALQGRLSELGEHLSGKPTDATRDAVLAAARATPEDAAGDNPRGRRPSAAMRRGRRRRRSGALPAIAAAAAVALIAFAAYHVLVGSPPKKVGPVAVDPAPKKMPVEKKEQAPPAVAKRDPVVDQAPPVPPVEVKEETPAVTPAPKTDEPPAPKPVPEPTIVRKPSKSEPAVDAAPTTTGLGEVAWVKGGVKYARGPKGRWTTVTAGVKLLPGDRFDTRTGRLHLRIAGAGQLFVNKSTRLELLEARTLAGRSPLVYLSKGEIFIDDNGERINVLTGSGLMSPVGTRFGVKTSGTSVVLSVEDGVVESRPRKRGEDAKPKATSSTVDLRERIRGAEAVQVPASHESTLRAGAKPSKPKKVNTLAGGAWHRAMLVESTGSRFDVVADYGFETAKSVIGDQGGVWTGQGAFGGSKGALKGTIQKARFGVPESPNVPGAGFLLPKKVPYKKGLVLEFRMRTDHKKMVLMLWNNAQRTNYVVHFDTAGDGAWRQVRLPVAEFGHVAFPDRKTMREGDTIGIFNIHGVVDVGKGGGRLLTLDNVRFLSPK